MFGAISCTSFQIYIAIYLSLLLCNGYHFRSFSLLSYASDVLCKLSLYKLMRRLGSHDKTLSSEQRLCTLEEKDDASAATSS